MVWVEGGAPQWTVGQSPALSKPVKASVRWHACVVSQRKGRPNAQTVRFGVASNLRPVCDGLQQVLCVFGDEEGGGG